MRGRDQVIITRPSPGNEEIAKAIALRGWTPISAPLLNISFAPLHRLSLGEKVKISSASYQGVIVASRQAVIGLCGLYPNALRSSVLIVAVGDQTAEDAKKAGFGHVKSAQGTATELVDLCRNILHPHQGEVLLASAEGAGLKIVDGLHKAGFKVFHLTLYTSQPVSVLPTSLKQAFRGEKTYAIMFFSALTATAFIKHLPPSLMGEQIPFITALAISKNVQKVLGEYPWKSIEIAARPTAHAMIERLGFPQPDSAS